MGNYMKYTPIRMMRQTTGSGDESFIGHEQMGRDKAAYNRTMRHETVFRLALSKPELQISGPGQ